MVNTYTPQPGPMKGVGSFVTGVIQVSSGGLLVLIGLIMQAARGLGGTVPGQVICLLFILGGLFLFFCGGRRCSLYSVAQRVRSLMRGKDRERLSLLAQATGKDYTHLVRDLRELSAKRYFPGAYVDLNRREFVVRLVGPQPPIVLGNTQLRETRKKSTAPIYMVGLTWLVYALLFPISGINSFIVLGALSVAVYLLAYKLFPDRVIISEAARKVEPPKPPEAINTGNEELDEVLTAAMKYMNELTALDVSITSERIDKPLQDLVRICQQIFDYIKKTPGKVRQIRQFMNYYLPTTIKLLKNYDELSRQPVKGDNIKAAMAKIEETILVIRAAFEKELDSLYEDKAMDITVDIEVLENMMEQEGLTTSQLDSVRTRS